MSSLSPSPARSALSEWQAVALIAGVQFVNVLDSMMVLPLGPDFARGLGIDVAHIGLIGGSYSVAAAIAGIVGSFFLDRFDRRLALATALVGLAIGTHLGSLATGLHSLVGARLVAGLFGGPAIALAIASLADLVPPERRGKAMGKVMGAFAAASVFGVPFGLEIARHAGFRAPFAFVGTLCMIAAFAAHRTLPSLRPRIRIEAEPKAMTEGPVFESTFLLALTSSALLMAGNFALIPNLSAYVQFNLGLPREHLAGAYALGGAASLMMMLAVGRLVDRFGSAPMVLVGTGFYLTMLATLFLVPVLGAVPLLALPAFMTTNGMRFVPLSSLSSRVPTEDRRARFLSIQSAVQHLSSSIGSIGASTLLVALPSGRLVGLERIAIGSMVVAAIIPLISFAVEWRVRAREEKERFEVDDESLDLGSGEALTV